MKPKTLSKLVIDAFMTVSLLALMGRQFWGDAGHEWIGAGMFALFIAHHVLNLNWYKTMFKGKYSPYRIVQLILDVLVFAAMLGLMVSGIILSQHVFIFLSISGGTAFARILHLLASYWGFVLMTLHLGWHWKQIMGFARGATKRPRSSSTRTTLVTIVGLAIAGYGLYVFINRELLSYMILQTQFAFLDYDESRILFYLDYLAMMGFFVGTTHTIANLLRKHSARRRKKQRAGGIG
jgi:hypothetical protein